MRKKGKEIAKRRRREAGGRLWEARMILRIVGVVALEGGDSKAVERRRQYGARKLTVRGGSSCMIIKSKELRWELPKHRGKAPRRQRAGYSCMTLGKNEGTLRRKHPSISNASGKVPRERTGDAIKNSAPIARPLL